MHQGLLSSVQLSWLLSYSQAWRKRQIPSLVGSPGESQPADGLQIILKQTRWSFSRKDKLPKSQRRQPDWYFPGSNSYQTQQELLRSKPVWATKGAVLAKVNTLCIRVLEEGPNSVRFSISLFSAGIVESFLSSRIGEGGRWTRPGLRHLKGSLRAGALFMPSAKGLPGEATPPHRHSLCGSTTNHCRACVKSLGQHRAPQKASVAPGLRGRNCAKPAEANGALFCLGRRAGAGGRTGRARRQAGAKGAKGRQTRTGGRGGSLSVPELAAAHRRGWGTFLHRAFGPLPQHSPLRRPQVGCGPALLGLFAKLTYLAQVLPGGWCCRDRPPGIA